MFVTLQDCPPPTAPKSDLIHGDIASCLAEILPRRFESFSSSEAILRQVCVGISLPELQIVLRDERSRCWTTFAHDDEGDDSTQRESNCDNPSNDALLSASTSRCFSTTPRRVAGLTSAIAGWTGLAAIVARGWRGLIIVGWAVFARRAGLTRWTRRVGRGIERLPAHVEALTGNKNLHHLEGDLRDIHWDLSN
jgi:hypothetical protein